MLGVRSSAVILAVVSVAPLLTAESPSPFSGRWDLTIITSKGAYPAWMEFADEAGTPAIRMVGRTGSVHPVKNAQVDQTHLTFEDGRSQAMWLLTVQDRKITGQAPDGQLIGVPAPALKTQGAHCLEQPCAALQWPRP